jgi:hypothetical protein
LNFRILSYFSNRVKASCQFNDGASEFYFDALFVPGEAEDGVSQLVAIVGDLVPTQKC